MARKKKKARKTQKVKGNVRSDSKKIIKQEQNYVCPICGKSGTDKTMNIHHKKPRCKGGSSARCNLVAWHIHCHNKYHQDYGVQISNDYGFPV